MKHEAKEIGILERLQRFDQRQLFIVLLILTVLPLLRPIGLPLKVTDYTTDFYRTIQDLPAGSIVVVANEYESTYVGEMWPQTLAVISHLLDKQVYIFALSLRPFSALMVEKALKENGAWQRKTYGTDFIVIGFIPGEIVAAKAFATNPQSLIKVDFYGNKVEDFPLMKKLKSATDITLLVVIYAELALGDAWVTQISDAYKRPTDLATSGANALWGYMYKQMNLVHGPLVSLRGAAEYEALLKRPGKGTSYIDILGILHITIVVLLIIANAAYLGQRALRRAKR